MNHRPAADLHRISDVVLVLPIRNSRVVLDRCCRNIDRTNRLEYGIDGGAFCGHHGCHARAGREARSDQSARNNSEKRENIVHELQAGLVPGRIDAPDDVIGINRRRIQFRGRQRIRVIRAAEEVSVLIFERRKNHCSVGIEGDNKIRVFRERLFTGFQNQRIRQDACFRNFCNTRLGVKLHA